MRKSLIFLAVVLICICAFNAKGAHAKSLGDIEKEMMRMGFLQKPESRNKDGYFNYKFHQKDSIFAVNYVFDSQGKFNRLIFEFQEGQSKGLAINLMNDILTLLGQPDDIANFDLLGNLITCRQNKFKFYCGDLCGVVSKRNFRGLPLLKIEFLNE